MSEKIVDRALSLAKRLGIETGAKTVKGVLRALRTGRRVQKWKHPSPSERRVRRVSAEDVVGWTTQSTRDRTRTLPEHEVLRVVLSAAIRGRVNGRVGAVPHSYRGSAYESVAAAVRQGRAVRFRGERWQMPHASHGQGGAVVRADSAPHYVMAADIWAALPPLPKGWRWEADEYGAFVAGPRVRDYHPTGAMIAGAIKTGSWLAMIERALEAAALRTTSQRAGRRERLVSLVTRLAPDLPVTIADSERAGNCLAGTLAWAREHSLAGDMATARVVGPLALSDSRVAAALVQAYRRARAGRVMGVVS